jgi:hypothetical protein
VAQSSLIWWRRSLQVRCRRPLRWEKVAADLASGEGGPRAGESRGGQEARWRWTKASGCSGAMEMPTSGPKAMENAEAAQRERCHGGA